MWKQIRCQSKSKLVGFESGDVRINTDFRLVVVMNNWLLFHSLKIAKMVSFFFLYMYMYMPRLDKIAKKKWMTKLHGQKLQNIYSFPVKTNQKFGPILGFTS